MNLIYDFETLSQHPENGPITSIAALVYDPEVEYTYSELLGMAHYMKFNVKEQVEVYNRIIDMETVKWWQAQGEKAQKQIRPSSEDVSITELPNFFSAVIGNSKLDKAYTRGNDFDPVFLKTLLSIINSPPPYSWWIIRDTRSMIEGLSCGSKISSMFIPEECKDEFVKHDPIHDIAMDVMRMQVLIKAIS